MPKPTKGAQLTPSNVVCTQCTIQTHTHRTTHLTLVDPDSKVETALSELENKFSALKATRESIRSDETVDIPTEKWMMTCVALASAFPWKLPHHPLRHDFTN